MTDNIISNEVQWKSSGTQNVLKDASAVRDTLKDTAKQANDANAAISDLNTAAPDVAPQMVNPQQFWKPLEDGAKQAGDRVKDAGGKMLDFGKAGMMVENMLDNVVPGLGNVFESFTSLNPAMLAGTAVITGLTFVFKDMHDRAEEARKAAEDAIKAEADRAYNAKDISQKLSLAQSGDAEARKRLIQEAASANAEMARVDAEFVTLRQAHADAVKAYNEKLEELNLRPGQEKRATGVVAALEEEKRALDASAKALEDYSGTLSDNLNHTEALNNAVQKLNLTQEEQAALSLATAQGAEGTAAALDKLNTSAEDTTKTLTDLAANFGGALKDAAEGVAKGVQEGIKQAAENRAKAEQELIKTNEELLKTEEEYGRTLADRSIEESRNRDMAALQDKLAAAQEYDRLRERNAKIADLQKQGQEADTAAQSKFMENQQKLLANYLKAEQNATEDYSRERVRKLQDLYNTLSGLAAQRDVAGFVNTRRAGLTGIELGDEDAGVAATRRREQFQQQDAELRSQFQKEAQVRQNQLQQRLRQEQQAGQTQIKQADIVNRQIQQLRDSFAAADLRARRMNEDATYKQTIDILQRKRMDELKITAGTAAGVINFLNQMQQAAARLRGFSSEMGARTPLSTSSQTPYFSPSASGKNVQVTVNNTVGQNVSQNDLQKVVTTIGTAFKAFAGVA